MSTKNRLERLRSIMLQESVDLVALGPGAHLAWLTGVRPHADERPLLFCVSQGYAGFLLPVLEADSARQQTDLPFHCWADEDGAEGAFAALLEKANSGQARHVVLDETMRADFAALVQKALPEAHTQFTASTIGQLRLCKDTDEYKRLKENARTADRSMQAAWSAMKVGMTELDVADIVKAAFKQQQATPLFWIIGAGANGAFPHHQTGETRLKRGDAVVMDIGGGMQNYSSDMTRMAVMGDAPEGYQQIHDVVEQAVQAAMAAARPGVVASRVDAAARNVIKDAGFGDYFIHRTGHGMGVEVHEPPYLTASSETVLEEGMVFSIEPGIYLPGRFGIRLEDIVILRSDGPEILSGLSRDVVVIGE